MRFGHEPASRLAHRRRAATRPLVVSLPHTGTDIPAEYRKRPRLALARAQGRRLVDRAALRFCRWSRRDGDPHGDLPHGDRRQPRSRPAHRSIRARRRRSCARPRPSTASRSTRRAPSRTRQRSPSGARAIFDPYHAALAAEIERLRAQHATSCSTIATRSARSFRACSRAPCPISTSAPMAARACAPGA